MASRIRSDRFVQLELPARGRGGRRPGAGRPKTGRAGVPHRVRPVLLARFPVHVTLRVKDGVPSLRESISHRALVGAIEAGRERLGCRVIHFSLQSNHVHFICEAEDEIALSCGLRGLTIRMARAFNRAHRLRGSVWADRYHARILRTPLEMRRVLVYVLGNWRHHGGERFPLDNIDPNSSAPWFEGYREAILPACAPAPVARGQTWLLNAGWKRHGLIAISEGAWRGTGVARFARPQRSRVGPTIEPGDSVCDANGLGET